MRILTLLSLLVLTGCSTGMSVKECQDRNWHDMGYEEGTDGKSLDRVDSVIRECGSHNVQVDRQMYIDGWKEGHRSLCSATNGLRHGREGRSPVTHCDDDLKESYHSAWTRGVKEYCTPNMGFSLGQSGQEAPTFCPAALNDAFMAAYKKGRSIKNTGSKKERESVANSFQIEELTKKIAEEEKIIAQYEANESLKNKEQLLKQHRGYRDYLSQQKMRLEGKSESHSETKAEESTE